jgi:hypothetical protein
MQLLDPSLSIFDVAGNDGSCAYVHQHFASSGTRHRDFLDTRKSSNEPILWNRKARILHLPVD